MKLILTRIFPLTVVVIVFAILGLRPRTEPEPPAPAPSPPVAKKPPPGRVAAIALKPRGRGGLRPVENPEQSLPATTNEMATVDTKVTDVVVPERKGPNWVSFLQRHADGDQAALPEFLGAITAENAGAAWTAARAAKLSPADRRSVYETLGKAGGGSLVAKLMEASDRHAAIAVAGWGRTDPEGALAWFRQLDIRGDQQLQEYLGKSHQIPEGFLDRVSNGLLDALYPAPDPTAAVASREAYSAETLRFVESLVEQHPSQAQAMMRELTERLLRLYDGSTLADWVTQIQNPAIKSSAVQRIIEADIFKDAPFNAVDWAFSLEDPKSRQNAISAAFGKLSARSSGVNPAEVANQLNEMPAGRDRDFAINGFAHGLVGTAPKDALTWAATISDEGFRAVVTENVSRRIEAQEKKQP